MKSLSIKRLDIPASTAIQDMPAILDSKGIAYESIDCDTWKCSTHNPQASFRIVHTGDRIILHFHVKDNEIRAHETEDNGKIWHDSCCEFFISPDCNEIYYNFECNCTGRLLLHVGDSLNTAARPNGTPEAYSAVKRWTSLGSDPFESTKKECEWDLVEVIEVGKALFQHNIQNLSGRRMRANFYKCADMVSEPHFLSWSPIDLPAPRFHCPELFGTVIFE